MKRRWPLVIATCAVGAAAGVLIAGLPQSSDVSDVEIPVPVDADASTASTTAP